ncbi:SRPBCC family protein [Nocardia sp. CC201C]|uniref:SRPBCC family protein n=1 Tax=Nocardia sp. CC201C TaxID=3044575 RepID=UPI0024A94777|nr:SRPBCC family protein [Nocardia sp. CC201C]
MRTKTDHRFVVDVDPEQVMEALLTVERLPDWSPSHQDVRVATRDSYGRPKRVYVSANLMGRPDRQVVEYTCTQDRIEWKVTESSAGAGGKGWFEIADTEDGTEVWYHSEIRLPIPVPGMLLKRTANRESETLVENFIAYVEDYAGIEPEAEPEPYPEGAYEPRGYAGPLYGGSFEPGLA